MIERINLLCSKHVCIVLQKNLLLDYFGSVGFVFDLEVWRRMGQDEKHFSLYRPFLLIHHTQYRNQVELPSQERARDCKNTS
ncbi:hypothetical protein NC652_031037 [Populus alba x Populus x berolinensis]|nr:hypothetical protein NC652_031037 [Populus alba x Populus x berolinensis]